MGRISGSPFFFSLPLCNRYGTLARSTTTLIHHFNSRRIGHDSHVRYMLSHDICRLLLRTFTRVICVIQNN